QAVFPAGWFEYARPWRQRPGTIHRAQSGAADGRRCRRRKHAGQRRRILVYCPSGDTREQCRGCGKRRPWSISVMNWRPLFLLLLVILPGHVAAADLTLGIFAYRPKPVMEQR